MFEQLTGDSAVLAQGGVYRTCDLYAFQGGLYARYGAGFVRLYANGSTSKDGLMVVHLVTDRQLYADKFGRLTGTGGNPVDLLALTKGV